MRLQNYLRGGHNGHIFQNKIVRNAKNKRPIFNNDRVHCGKNMTIKSDCTRSEGFVVGPQFDGRPARIRHDETSRTEDLPLKMTNETFPLRPVADGFVDSRSKITFKLADRPNWVERFHKMMGDFVFGQFASPGYGWMDTNHDGFQYKFSLIQCGGNLVNVTSLENGYAFVQTQDFNRTPEPNLTYRNAPHLNIKQVLVGRSVQHKIYWITDKKRGDVIFPAVSPVQAAIPIEQLEFFPKLPWVTWLDGEVIPVKIFAYRFVGSNTFGLIRNRWRLLEEMQITGNGSFLDRKVYVEGWIETCPPPVIGWTRGVEETIRV